MSLPIVRNGFARLAVPLPFRLTLIGLTALGAVGLITLVRAEPPLVPMDGGEGQGSTMRRAVVPGIASDPADDPPAPPVGATPRLSANLWVRPPFDFSSPLAAWSGVTDRFGAQRAKGAIHGGLDLALDGYPSSPVLASCSGTVDAAGSDAGYGNFVIIDCGSGWSTLAGHLETVLVWRGQSVAAGAQIGVSGSTGFSTGEHVHFEVRYLGQPINPEHVLDFYIPAWAPISTGPIDESLYEGLVDPDAVVEAPADGEGEEASADPTVAESPSPETSTPAASTPDASPTTTATPPGTSTASATASPTSTATASPAASATLGASPTADASPGSTPVPVETSTPATP